MNIKELKEYIKDLPDDMLIATYSEDNIANKPASHFEIIEGNNFLDFLIDGDKYLLIK